MTAAHESTVTIRFIERYPAHEPREQDAHYKYFHRAKARLKRQGLLVCNVKAPSHYGVIELHHAAVEFAHVNDIDVVKFNDVWGLNLTDEEFKAYAEGAPGPNGECALEPLCTEHHRGVSGIHSLPTPEWNVLRTSKDDHPVLIAQSNSEIGVVPPDGRLRAVV